MKPLDSEQQKAVLDGAMKLFELHALQDITLDRLSKISGVPSFNIVRHYHSSDNILQAVLERELELMAGAGQPPDFRMPGETLEDELRVLAGVIVDQYRKRIPFLRKLMAEALRDEKAGALYYRTFIMQGRLLFTEFLQVRRERGELREEIDVEAASATFLSSLIGILMTHELFGGRTVEALDDERMLSQTCRTFLRGVAKP
ncbi:MAG: Transcriptional regulator, TetR family [Bryobacterales bacterium]|nr:Transcriptional regulator, TetR family [Bryobacterales bacterium]